jgi:hypothetical protein
MPTLRDGNNRVVVHRIEDRPAWSEPPVRVARSSAPPRCAVCRDPRVRAAHYYLVSIELVDGRKASRSNGAIDLCESCHAAVTRSAALVGRRRAR